MSNKQEILNQLQDLVKNGELDKSEILNLFSMESKLGKNTLFGSSFSIISSLIGGFIIFLGVVVLVSINWSYLGDVGQILATLGSGIVAYTMGTLLMYSLRVKYPGISLHLIGGLLIPVGIFVWLSKFDNPNVDVPLVVFSVFLSLMFLYIITNIIAKNQIFTLFSIIYGSIAYWAGFSWVVNRSVALVTEYKLVDISLLVFGIVYLLVAYGIKEFKNLNIISALLYLCGLVFMYSSLFSLVYNTPTSEALYLLTLIIVFYLISVWKSRILLVVNSITFVAVLIYFSFRYFVDTIGWPVALIFSGTTLISIGYLAVILDKKNRLVKVEPNS